MHLTFLTSFPDRLLRYVRSPWLLFAVVLVAYSTDIQAQASTVTSNAYVEADVSNSDGLISIFYDKAHQEAIMFPAQTSLLTVLVNGTYYTNNSSVRLVPNAQPAYPKFLTNGVTKKIKDTIETVWQPEGPNAFDIVQDVYPVQFPTDGNLSIPGSGQIVIKFILRNHGSAFLPAQAQYLLDVELSDPPNPFNDNAPITTRYGYLTTAWTSFPPTNPVPPYFIATMQSLDGSEVPGAEFPTLMAEGYFDDSYAPEPMGLMEPLLFSYTDWTYVSTEYTWGGPSSPPPGQPTIGDEALLIQWGNSGANQNDTAVIGCFSYGSAACAPMCIGNALDALIIHPDHILWTAPSGPYVPNHFPVDAIVWNTNANNGASATGTQLVQNDLTGAKNGPVQIVSPLPTTLGGYSQNHSMSGGSVPGHFSSSISWEDTVLANPSVLQTCSTDSIYDIIFTVSAGGVGNTNFITGTCSCPIEVDCQQKDVLAPRHSAHLVVGNLNSCGNPKEYSDSVFDDRAYDQGLKSITWFATPANNTVNVNIGTIASCTNGEVPITVTQVDTLLGPCVYFTFTDCAGNISWDTICFSHCLPPVPFDTLPPRFRLLNRHNQNVGDNTNAPCEYQCSQWVVTDSVEEPLPGLQRDGGLRSIAVFGAATNMNFQLSQPLVAGMKEDSFTTCVMDSMQDGSVIILATDLIGNQAYDTISYCTVQDTTPPDVSVQTSTHNWLVTVSETRPWDRGIDSVELTQVHNCVPQPNPSIKNPIRIDSITWLILPIDTCADTLYFYVQVTDTFQGASYYVQSWDCAGNVSSKGFYHFGADLDLFCPSDTVIEITPQEFKVIFSDFHLDINGNPIKYDAGLDSIWFYNVHNMSMIYKGISQSIPNDIKELDTGTLPRLYAQWDTIIFFVTDTTIHDTAPAQVCWGVIDGSTANPGGLPNSLCNSQTCVSYTLIQDTTPPIVTVTYDPCDSLGVTVTDTRPNDRGIDSVWLDNSHNVNMHPFSESGSGAASLSFNLTPIDADKSSLARLFAFDVYGEQSVIQSVRDQHTDVVDLAIYRQDLAMTGFPIVKTTNGVTFKIPVYLTTTDTIPLAQKNITQYQFSFNITGSNLLNYVGTALPVKLAAAGWTATPSPGTGPGAGPPYTITGQGPAPLGNLDATDTLVYLVFTGAKSPDVESAQIAITADACGNNVTYNAGKDSTVAIPNVTASLPAPYGLLNGGTIVFMDTCATIVGNNPNPTVLTLAPLIPNPSTTTASIEYTIPTEAPVRLELFDPLGQKVRTLVTEVQKQGTYQIRFDPTGLPGTTYFLRLESNGAIASQRVIVAH